MCVNLSIFAKFTQTRSRKFYLHKLDLNRVILLESCGKILQAILAGKSCRKLLQENCHFLFERTENQNFNINNINPYEFFHC